MKFIVQPLQVLVVISTLLYIASPWIFNVVGMDFINLLVCGPALLVLFFLELLLRKSDPAHKTGLVLIISGGLLMVPLSYFALVFIIFSLI